MTVFNGKGRQREGSSGCQQNKRVTEKQKWIWRNRVYMPDKKATIGNRALSRNQKGQQWYDANRNIIIALGRATGLHADAIFDFLYSLSLQNFSMVLNPNRTYNGRHVPFSAVDTCDTYMTIFDDEGNVRNLNDPETLSKLVFVLQSLLNKNEPHSNGICADLIPQKASKGKLQRRGEPSSSVIDVGQRRRHFFDNYSSKASMLDFYKNCWRSGRNFGLLTGNFGITPNDPLFIGNPNIAGNQDVDITEFFNSREAKSSRLSKSDDSESIVSIEYRIRELRRLLEMVLQKSAIPMTTHEMVEAIKYLNLRRASKDQIKLRAKETAAQLSSEYSRLEARMPKPFSKKMGYLSDKRRLGLVPDWNDHPPEEEPHPRYVYGEPIPVLYHEPFNRRESRTWLRRHPAQARVNEKGDIVIDKDPIRPYIRSSIRSELDRIRMRTSIRSTYYPRSSSEKNPLPTLSKTRLRHNNGKKKKH